jgi:hypothetical protein
VNRGSPIGGKFATITASVKNSSKSNWINTFSPIFGTTLAWLF